MLSPPDVRTAASIAASPPGQLDTCSAPGPLRGPLRQDFGESGGDGGDEGGDGGLGEKMTPLADGGASSLGSWVMVVPPVLYQTSGSTYLTARLAASTGTKVSGTMAVTKLIPHRTESHQDLDQVVISISPSGGWGMEGGLGGIRGG